MKPTKKDIENIKKIKESLEILRVDLSQAQVQVFQHPAFAINPQDSNVIIDIDYSTSYKILKQIDLDLLLVSPKITINISSDNDIKIQISPEYIAVYKITNPEEFSDKVIMSYSQFNTLHTILPYARSYVDDMSRKIGLKSPITLPLLNIKWKEAENKNDKTHRNKIARDSKSVKAETEKRKPSTTTEQVSSKKK